METDDKVEVVKEWLGKYQINDSYRPIAKALVAKYREISYIPVEKILFIDNTESLGKNKNKLKLAQISVIPVKWNEIIHQLTGRRFWYVMEFFKRNTQNLSKEQIVATIYHELRHIGHDGNIIAHDIEDWSNMVTAFGPRWNAPEANIPNLLDDEVDWDRIVARQLPGLDPDKDCSTTEKFGNTAVTIAAADWNVTTTIKELEQAAEEARRLGP